MKEYVISCRKLKHQGITLKTFLEEKYPTINILDEMHNNFTVLAEMSEELYEKLVRDPIGLTIEVNETYHLIAF